MVIVLIICCVDIKEQLNEIYVRIDWTQFEREMLVILERIRQHGIHIYLICLN